MTPEQSSSDQSIVGDDQITDQVEPDGVNLCTGDYCSYPNEGSQADHCLIRGQMDLLA